MVIHRGKWKDVPNLPSDSNPYDGMDTITATLKEIRYYYDKYTEKKKSRYLSRVLKLLKLVSVLSKQLANISSVVEVRDVYFRTSPIRKRIYEIAPKFSNILEAKRERYRKMFWKHHDHGNTKRKLVFVGAEIEDYFINCIKSYRDMLNESKSDILSIEKVMANIADPNRTQEITDKEISIYLSADDGMMEETQKKLWPWMKKMKGKQRISINSYSIELEDEEKGSSTNG